MIIKFEYIQNKHLKRVLEHSVYLTILFILIPCFFYFETSIVLPAVVEEWTISYIIHLCCATFLLLNIIGNMLYGMLTNTTIKGKLLHYDDQSNWTLCAACECLRPPRAWHCQMCNICVLNRDHHCTFLATCVGYYNQRYFIYFVFHIFVAMLYAFYFNVYFLSQFISWNHGLVLIKFVFPLASFAFDFGVESLYIFLVVINVIVAIFTGFLFIFHIKNIIKGKTTPETKHCDRGFLYDYGWKLNLVQVFGRRWYLTWISPFIVSPLPGDGIRWIETHKHQ